MTMAKIIPLYSPKESYMRHIAHANIIYLKQVLRNIQNPNNNEKQ